ncbi:MAG TPA: F0F1 ATP synthase subunit A [Solirubrobacteraceae bacterium]|nr:F0F1 ATP synthase subunit A [Solirubrobacteraceae bacterium]
MKNLSTRAKILLGLAALLLPAILLGILFGSAGEQEFQPQEEFKLEPYIELHAGPLDLSITKGVVYLVLAAVITVAAMLYIANRMQARPNRIQTAVETAYIFMRDNIARGNMDDAMTRRWFPFVGTLFLFIWISNMIGYIPLPLNASHPIEIGGLSLPTFAIYAATANISVPLVLTLMVWLAYHAEGVRAKGPIKYVKGWVPAGVSGIAAFPIFLIEAISQFVRIISLSVRLFANMLAGHLLILFMGGGLAIILGLAALGWITLPVAWVFFLFEIVLIATLQAFIFATLTAIYLGEAVAEAH